MPPKYLFLRRDEHSLHEAPQYGITIIFDRDAEGSAPLKLPATHCLHGIFIPRVRNCPIKEWYFTDESTTSENIASTSPTYSTH